MLGHHILSEGSALLQWCGCVYDKGQATATTWHGFNLCVRSDIFNVEKPLTLGDLASGGLA